MNDTIPIPDVATSVPVNNWTREAIWAFNGPDMGGDNAVGIGYEARYTRRLIDGTYAVIGERYFVEDLNSIRQVTEGDEGYEPNAYVITNQTEFMHCSDVEDVGGTEIHSDLEYEPIDRMPFANYDPDEILAWYENQCLALAAQDERNDYSFMDDYGDNLAALLRPGDHFWWDAADESIAVTVKGEREAVEMSHAGAHRFRFWCSREDTTAEGYVYFVDGATIRPVAFLTTTETRT